MSNVRIAALGAAVLVVAGAYLLLAPTEFPERTISNRGGSAATSSGSGPVDSTEPASKAKPSPAPAKSGRSYDSQLVVAAASRRASMTEPLPPVDAPLVATFQGLYERAMAGDAKASCRLSIDLATCGEDLSQMIELGKNMDRTIAGLPESTTAEVRGATLRAQAKIQGEIARMLAFCRDFKVPEDVPPPWQFTLAAALGDNPVAMSRFVMGINIGLVHTNPLETADGWMAYRQHASGFLDRALELGEPTALVLAGRSYHERLFGLEIHKPDPVMAIAYYNAAWQRATPAYRLTLNNYIEKVKKDFGLSAADVARASGLGGTISSKFPNSMPLDLTGGTHSLLTADRCS